MAKIRKRYTNGIAGCSHSLRLVAADLPGTGQSTLYHLRSDFPKTAPLTVGENEDVMMARSLSDRQYLVTTERWRDLPK